MDKLMKVLAVPWIMLAAVSCKPADLETACIVAGACAVPRPSPVDVVLLCDRSPGASCTNEVLDSTAAHVLGKIVEVPGSTFEVWMMGSDAGSSRIVAQVEMTMSTQKGMGAVEAHQERQVEAGIDLIRREAEPVFRSPPPSQTPLIDVLGKIDLTRPVGDRRWFVVIVSDGLVYSDSFDFECFPPKDQAQLMKSVFEARTLTESSFENAVVIFAWMHLGKIDNDRCEAEIGRSRRIQELWTSLLTRAGAREVRFEPGLPRLDGLDSPAKGGES